MGELGRLDSIVFDLDGTFWDTCHSCAVAWNRVAARNRIAFREITYDDVRRVTGRPHEDCIREVFAGLSEPELRLLITETMVEDNVAVAEHGGEIYEGVREGLARLKASHDLFIVSNCQQGYIEIFLEWSGMADLFQDHECWGNTGQPKGENLKAVITRNGLAAPVMVGDTDGDYQAARQNHIPFVQVTYGFGEPLQGCAKAGSFTELVEMMG